MVKSSMRRGLQKLLDILALISVMPFVNKSIKWEHARCSYLSKPANGAFSFRFLVFSARVYVSSQGEAHNPHVNFSYQYSACSHQEPWI
jgi:hypothetical protein